VQADEDSVACDRQVLLDEIGALLEGQPIGRKRVLRCIRRRAPMGDVGLGRSLGLRREGHGEQQDDDHR